MTSGSRGELDWGVAARPLPGQTESGDCHFVGQTATGWLLTAADGLGHGREAAAASAIFLDMVKHHIDDTPVALIRRCHEALKSTRGIACTIITIDCRHDLLSWVGVGNVEGVVRHLDPEAAPTDYVTMRGGIVGYRLPELQPSYLRLSAGDTLALATDGIAGDFVSALSPVRPPAQLAGHILDRYAKAADDALVLIARWQPEPTKRGGETP